MLSCECPTCLNDPGQCAPLPVPDTIRLDRDVFGRLEDAPLQAWMDPWQDLGGEAGSA